MFTEAMLLSPLDKHFLSRVQLFDMCMYTAYQKHLCLLKFSHGTPNGRSVHLNMRSFKDLRQETEKDM